jgi:glycosyltransferase involved in cell wall biosynthesis
VIIPRAARNAKIVQCPSNYTALEAEKYLRVPSERWVITEGGHEHVLRFNSDDSIAQQHSLEKGGYLLAVGSLNPNKNFAAILRAMKISGVETKLVIAGGANPRIFRDQGFDVLSDKAIYVGRVSDDQLRNLYENALGFIYPSFYEGWGLPPGEAMLLGCPVISSNTSSLPQVCGDAVLYCDPADDNSIAEQITKLCGDALLREKLVVDGLAQSKKFTWRQVALNVWRPIEKACRE